MNSCAISYGDGKPAPPIVCREIIELQRASNKIARTITKKLLDSHSFDFSISISPTIVRFVVAYGIKNKPDGVVELNFVIGDPIDDAKWIKEVANRVIATIRSDESELYIYKIVDELLIDSNDGSTIYQYR
ncbi:hypothetical protein [Pseudomonas sp. N040]|uniref:hypothetical protein n=1 Tax=Pseudomonas sp. N040 TaxID=2785325 RepID=UPI0018A3308C|nr:hypothetical protein [Pseudomonas sp. N040]MBF7728596.1 hypothetical protein [Pseudomonas sp. N040]MBW7012236.1 hypothetical protein [Pseudomonas sp. N040]